MKTLNIDLNKFSCISGSLEEIDQAIMITAPEDGLCLEWSELNNILLQSSIHYLSLHMKNMEEHSLTFNIDFYKKHQLEEFDMRITFSILPMVEVVVPIPLKLLNSQELFVDRTPGRLRMMVYGKPLLPEEIDCIRLTTLKCYKEQKIAMYQAYLSEEEPVCFVPSIPLMDEMGQWKPKAWKNRFSNVEQCTQFLQNARKQAETFHYQYSNMDWDIYGGWKKKKFDSTGWFHTAYDGSRWWMVDPLGHAFFTTGIDCINPGTDTRIDVVRELCEWIPNEPEYKDAMINSGKSVNYGIVNLIRTFGENDWWENWAEIVKMYLYQWNVNTIGNWTSMKFIRYAKLPYVLPLDAYSEQGFPSTTTLIFRDFPDVFSEEYEVKAEVYASSLIPFKEDPLLIGYFMRNEPEWGFVYELNIAEEMLANPSLCASKAMFINAMVEKYKEIRKFNLAWNLNLPDFTDLNRPLRFACQQSSSAKLDLEEFSKRMITRYVEIPARACRKIDENHLNLGMRYAYITDPIMLSGHEFFDVFSINSYQMNPYEQVNNLGRLLDKPIMIGEFHFGALDRGLTSHGLRGVPNQKERAIAYRYYVEQGIRSPYFLGAHYFSFCDESCLGRFDGENYQIGLTDICTQAYDDMVSGIADCHRTIYNVCIGEQEPTVIIPQEIPAIHC